MANNYQIKDGNGTLQTISSTDIGGGVEAPNVRVCDSTATNFQPTGDAVGRAIFTRVCDGTNSLPTGDAVARAIIVKPSDGTSTVILGSAANLSAAASGNGASVFVPAGQWSVTHAPAANTQATASKAAGGAGVRHVCTAISATLVAGATAPTATTATLNLRDGATGAVTVLMSWTLGLEATAGKTVTLSLSGLSIFGTANTAMTLEYSGASGANSLQSVNIVGYDVS